MPDLPDDADLTARMQRDLRTAITTRDRPAISALRSVLAAVANAEAPPIEAGGDPSIGRLGEHPRLALAAGTVDRLVDDEIRDRRETIELVRPHGQDGAVAVLHAEIAVLSRYVRQPDLPAE